MRIAQITGRPLSLRLEAGVADLSGAALVGGQDASVDDTATGDGAGPGDTWVSVTIGAGDATGVNLGFAYNLIVNTGDDGAARRGPLAEEIGGKPLAGKARRDNGQPEDGFKPQ